MYLLYDEISPVSIRGSRTGESRFRREVGNDSFRQTVSMKRHGIKISFLPLSWTLTKYLLRY